MKTKCSICGEQGIIEKRGKSVRIVHYAYLSGKRVFSKHTVTMGTDGNNMGTKNPEASSIVRRVGFEPTNPCGIGASVLRLWPCWATSA